jgi:hypothetical protein
MSTIRENITADRLRWLLTYDPETGVFRWLGSTSRRVRAGTVAGSNRQGYRRIRIDGRTYQLHRLAWLYMMEEWPDGDLDHINGDPSDNRWCNLREASQSLNNANSRVSRRNTSGFKGVRWNKGRRKWRAGIKVRGRPINLGNFDDRRDAALAYATAAYALFGEFARPQWRVLLREMRGANI